ncbi:MAG: uracil DNA N-glycosylase Thp1 [Ramalina farinacea]|uniref:Uracil DNA N-glycosylase Thp1 n=1 Tax=Ramalina farinacea TaxID=258253 RepID=A0AA43QPG3_9LECA|nr:uracil DNA N-glycosylase Thp1 [Ramalina farinacea]
MAEPSKSTFTPSIQRFALNSDSTSTPTSPPIKINTTTHLTRAQTAPRGKRKANPPPSTSPRKRPKRNAAPSNPTINNLTDSLLPNLITLFIGLNPGLRTASSGHAYAHPSNLFWKLLHKSRCTPRLCLPSEDRLLPQLYALGFTNLVERPTRDGSSLSSTEMDAGVGVLEAKVREWRPESVCIVGKGIWEAVWRVRHGRKIRGGEFRYGWQDKGENMGVIADDGGGAWEGASVFVATTTSGLAAGMRPHEKEEVWRGLGEWVEGRRRERGIPDEGRREGEVDNDRGYTD